MSSVRFIFFSTSSIHVILKCEIKGESDVGYTLTEHQPNDRKRNDIFDADIKSTTTNRQVDTLSICLALNYLDFMTDIYI